MRVKKQTLSTNFLQNIYQPPYLEAQVFQKKQQEQRIYVLCMLRILALMLILTITAMGSTVVLKELMPGAEEKLSSQSRRLTKMQLDSNRKLTNSQGKFPQINPKGIKEAENPNTSQETNKKKLTVSEQRRLPKILQLNNPTTKLNFNIKLTAPIKQYTNHDKIKEMGIDQHLQICSPYDYLSLQFSEGFAFFKKNWEKNLKYQIFSFEYDPSLQTQQQVLELKSIKNKTDYKNYMQNINIWKKKDPAYNDYPLIMSSNILHNASNPDPKLYEAEYVIADLKYNISSYKSELPICLLTGGYNIGSRNIHIPLMESILQQNYTNYHIVAFDDNSLDETAEILYQYINNTNTKLKNRITIARNQQHLSAAGGLYFWARKLCRPGDIVVNVDMDDRLIGRQVFKIMNAVYHNPETWYVYTRLLKQSKYTDKPAGGLSRPFTYQLSLYRQTNAWATSSMRTFRSELMQKIPLEHLIQYIYNETTQQFTPMFVDTDADRFIVYAQLQLSGSDRIRFINDSLYYYNLSMQTSGRCYHQHQLFDEYKSKLRYPLKRLNKITDQTEYVERSKHRLGDHVMVNLAKYHLQYRKCLEESNKEHK